MSVTYRFRIEADGKEMLLYVTHISEERIRLYLEREMFYNNYKEWKIINHYKLRQR